MKSQKNQNLLHAAIKQGQKKVKGVKSKAREIKNKKYTSEYQRFSNATQRQLKRKPPEKKHNENQPTNKRRAPGAVKQCNHQLPNKSVQKPMNEEKRRQPINAVIVAKRPFCSQSSKIMFT